MEVEVAYATPERQIIIPVKVAAKATVYDAAVQSGIAVEFPEIDLETVSMGVFGKVVKNPKNHPLREGDRVELYRPLTIDPKQARLNRARKAAG
ncbi:RnfH family protein [Marinobacter sp. X15-166B]|uniref:RnfH family protein n=1 Tax=Marinobacter sp. X15-166B TaxID=1897620 RepID=UPI00085C5586|nr:RnfH family protein [Marinobacter sp. X15-166B]OEY65627.1 RnfH family protein [Marinobacter sp. X15-166B]